MHTVLYVRTYILPTYIRMYNNDKRNWSRARITTPPRRRHIPFVAVVCLEGKAKAMTVQMSLNVSKHIRLLLTSFHIISCLFFWLVVVVDVEKYRPSAHRRKRPSIVVRKCHLYECEKKWRRNLHLPSFLQTTNIDKFTSGAEFLRRRICLWYFSNHPPSVVDFCIYRFLTIHLK